MIATYVAGVMMAVGGFRVLSLLWAGFEGLPLGIGSVAMAVRNNFTTATWAGKIFQIVTPLLMVTAGVLLWTQHLKLKGAGRVTTASA